jgi:transcriptional regulator
MEEKKKIAINIYSKINVALKRKRISQRGLAHKINMTPQTFSDNMKRLANGVFPKLDFLIDVQHELKIDLGLNFKY